MPKKIHRNSLKPGYKIQWYEIKQVLGQGGFGITYLVTDTNLDKDFAIKEYLPIEFAVRDSDYSVHPATDGNMDAYESGLNNFINEAKTLSKLNHPNIVKVHSVFELNNTAYMVMDLEKGRTLQEILKNKKTLEESALLDILIPLFGALGYLHRSNFIHRDVKPDNILIRDSSEPVLIDFGAARHAIAARALTTIVSPGYAPIEQYKSDNSEQGPWSDIYSLGATLYRATCGVPPADAVDRSHALAKGAKDPYVPATEVANKDNYSKRLLKAIDHSLSFDDKDRPRSLDDFYDEIQPKWEHKKGKNKSKIIILTSASLAFLLLIFGAIMYFNLSSKEIYQRSPPEKILISKNELSGLWDTDYGTIDFQKVSEKGFVGEYTFEDGRLYGKLEDRIMTGHYIEGEDSQKCSSTQYDSYHWGTFVFKFDKKFTKFDGWWGSCSLPNENQWKGNRIR